MNKRLLSMFLALCMAFTLLPISAMAEEADTTIGGGGEIISFASLTETEKTVTTGTSIQDLELPETLTATVRTAVSIGEDSVQDSGSPETATPTTAAEPELVESTVDIPVKWESTPEYDMGAEGEYVFTPVIEGYTVSAALPEITVTVGATIMGRGLVAPLSVTTYDLWVGGVRVTSDNKDSIIGDGISGTVTYDPGTSTLTLNNATITGAHEGPKFDSVKTSYYGIYAATAHLNIVLVGSNTVTGKSESDIYSAGIYTTHALTLSGSGSLNVSGGTGNVSFGIYAQKNLTISSGAITATSASAYYTSIAIFSGRMVTISDGAVEASANTATSNSYGMTATNGYTINGGTVTATGFRTGMLGELTVTGGTVTVQSDTKALDGTLMTSGYTGCTVTASTNKNGSSSVAYNATNLATYKYLKVTPATTYTITYDRNEGSGSMPAGTAIAGQAFILPANGFTAAGGYRFKTWAIDTLTSAQVNAGETYIFTKDTAVYAIWEVIPTSITSVNTSNANGTYTKGDELRFAVDFNENVIVNTGGGTPYLSLQVGSQACRANYESGSGTASLVFSYTVQSGDVDQDGIVCGSSVVLNGGSIKNAAENNPNLMFSPPDITGIRVDAIPPSITTQPINLTLNEGQSAIFSVTASGTAPLFYQWQIDPTGTGTAFATIPSVTFRNYTILETSYLLNGSLFRCLVANSVGTISSNQVTLTVNQLVTATPTVTTTTVAKISAEQASVSFALTNSPAYTNGQAWKIYTNSSKTIQATGISAANIGNALTLTHAADVPAATYYVAVTESGKTESDTLALTIGAYVPPDTLTGTATISNAAPKIGDRLIGSLVGSNNTGTLTYVWKSDGTKVGIGTEYTVAATDLDKAITLEISSSVQAGTITSDPTAQVRKKTAPMAPSSAPTLVSKTYNTVTLTANAVYEFSKDGTEWQTSNVFGGLTASTAYTFYQRVAETSDTEGSAASTGFRVTTNSNGGGDDSDDAGSSSNDNSSSVIVTPPAPDKPNSPTQGEIKVSGTVDDKGNATVNLTDKTVTDAFDKALADVKKNGNEQNGITLVLRVDNGRKTISSVTVNLPKTVQDTIIAKKIINTVVVVDNPDIRICMDLATVQEINKQAKSDVNITVTGKKDIDGTTYTFDRYGIMADVPKNLKYTTYTVQKGDSFWRIAHKLGCTMSELERLNNKNKFDLIHPDDVLRVPEK